MAKFCKPSWKNSHYKRQTILLHYIIKLALRIYQRLSSSISQILLYKTKYCWFMYWTVFFLVYYMSVTLLTRQEVASGSWKCKSQINHYCHKLCFLLTGVWHQTRHCCGLLRTNFWSVLCYGAVKSPFWCSWGLLMWISAAYTDRQEQELFSCELNLVLN